MTTIAADYNTLENLRATAEKARNDLTSMRRINAAFRNGRAAFLACGYAETDFQKFTDTMQRHPDYGSEPFPRSLIHNKIAEIRRLDSAIRVGVSLLSNSKAS